MGLWEENDVISGAILRIDTRAGINCVIGN